MMRGYSLIFLMMGIVSSSSPGQEPAKKNAAPLSVIDAGIQLGETKQALELCRKLATAKKDAGLEKEVKKWQDEYETVEGKIRSKASKGEAIGEDLELALRILKLGVGDWSGKFLAAKAPPGPPGQAAQGPAFPAAFPLQPGRDFTVTMDFQDWMALQFYMQFANRPEVQSMMGKIQQQQEDAKKGIDFNKPGAYGLYFQRLGEMAAESGRNADKRETPKTPEKRPEKK